MLILNVIFVHFLEIVSDDMHLVLIERVMLYTHLYV